MNATEFENHVVFDKLELVKSRLSEDEVKEKIEIDKLSYYDASCKYISDRFKLTIPILVPIAELNAMATELEAALTQINSFIGNNNIGHLNNSNNNFNSILTRLRSLPIPLSDSDFDFSKSISSFEEIVKSKYKEIEKENKTLKIELTKIKDDLVLKQTEITKVTNLLTKKTTEITNLTSTFKTDYANIKSSAEQSFDNSRKAFRSEITTDRETFRTEINKDKEAFRKEIDEKEVNIDNSTNKLVEGINTKLTEAKKLVNVIGNVGVTGNYQKIANEHKKTANQWRFAAILFMTVLSGLLIFAIWDISSDSYDWTKSLVRVIAAAALSYPATYAARESSKHRKLENSNRKLELELASLTPFIEMLPEEKKREIKATLVEKYFGNNLVTVDDSRATEEELSLSGFEKILRALIPILNK